MEDGKDGNLVENLLFCGVIAYYLYCLIRLKGVCTYLSGRQ